MKTSCCRTVTVAILMCLLAGVAGATWSHNSLENNAVCTSAGGQLNAVSVSDGAGGAIIVWEDDYSGHLDLYAQRMDAWGNAIWSAGGIVVCDASDDQHVPTLVSDGAGGGIVTWQDYRNGSDYDIYAQKIDASGATQWGTGVQVSTATGDQDSAFSVGDGSGGVIVAWEDHRSGSGGGDIYAQRVDSSGAMPWQDAVVVDADIVGTRRSIGMAADGFGGAILAWVAGGVCAARLDDLGNEVWRSSGYVLGGSGDHPAVMGDGFGGVVIVSEDTSVPGDINLAAQRLDALGEPLWGTSGMTVCGLAGDQERPRLVTDGSGGAVIAWKDASSSIYVQRVSGLGVLLWPATGMPVSVGVPNASDPRLLADGAGGAVVVWHGGLPDHEDVYAQRVDSSGMPLWTSNGEVVSNAYSYQRKPAAVGDGAGGVVVAWHDCRTGFDTDIYAQRVERNGFLGYPAPTITSIMDHPDDQGGEIIVSWGPSYLDVWPRDDVDSYTIWRRFGGTTARRTTSSPPLWLTHWGDPGLLERYGWAQVGQTQAYQLPEYAYVVPSFGDLSDTGVIWTDVMVMAHSYILDDYWVSDSDSAYSIDNWAPGPPDPLAARVVGPDIELTWSPSGYRDGDLSHYDVHRSGVSGFAPDGLTLVGTTADTLFLDVEPGDGTWYYRVVAEDVHGNESTPSSEVWATMATGVDDVGLSGVLTIWGNSPNPFNPATEIAFDLPEAADVRLAVYSLSGGWVATLRDRAMEPGRYAVSWDGCDGFGRKVPSGVYFARLEAGEETAVHKMVLLK
jgi:hypothetical protein